MASYDAQINLLVSGQRELDRLTDRLRSIERQIIDINRLGVKPQQRDPATGRFGADPDRENRIRLARIQRIGKEEERRARLTSASLRTQNSELERSILLQSKLNSAVDLYERKLEELSRGGGGARLGEDLQAQIRDIRAAYQAATDGGTKNLSLVRSLATELGRVVERQNEINRLSSFQSKAFYDTQRFERRIAELRRAGVDASAFGGVGGQMRALRSAQARGNESEAKDATRRIKEALDRIARNLDETIREARTQQSAQKAARSWETFFEEASTTALLLKQNQKNASAKFAQFFEDAANQALQISQNAKDTRKSWQFFFEDAQKEADRLRTERLSNFARLRGNPNQYSAEAGPLPASKSGSPRYFAEAKEIADQLLIAENEIAKIREQSLNESLRLESERLSLIDKRKEKEKQIKNVLLEAVSFGKGSQVKDIVNQVKTGGRNALVRGGLGLGALGAGGLYEGITGLGDVNLGVLNAIKGPVGAAASAIGDSINSALGGVPAIINSVLSGLGDIPGVLGLAAVAAYAFAPAMKTAGEAVYLAGQKFGETKFGKNIKLTLDRQTNIFESGINAASQMTMPIDASGFDKNLEIRQSAKDTSETWRVFFEDTAAFALQLKQNAKDTSKKWTEFFQDASYQALQIKENNKSTRKSWQVFFEDAASQTLLIKQQAKETAKSWQEFFEDAANQALQIKQNAKATAQSWRSFFENAASEALRVSQEAKNTSNNWRQFFEDAAYQALQIKQNGKDTSESWRVFFEDAAYEALSIKEKAKSTRSSWQQFFEDAELEAKRLREGKKTGLQSSLDKLQEARGAGKAFLGGASPAEAIDKIVREFNTGKTVIGNAGQNAASTFVDNIKGAAGSAASAGKTFASSAAKAILKVFGIASPSRFMIELVKNLADTYVSQMEKEYPRIRAATAKAFGEQTLLRDVAKLRATNKGFEEYGRPSTGFKPFPLGAGTAGATSEFNDLINSFRRQIAELTTQPGIYGNLLNALPNSRITTDLIGAANRRAAASEIPSFMSTQRMLGPGELERFISAELAKYLRDIKIPNPWVGAIGDYKEFIAKVISETDKLRVSSQVTRLLPQGQIAGLLPPGGDEFSGKFENRIRQALERSAQRGAAVFAEDTLRRLNTGLLGLGGGGTTPPGVPPGGAGGTGAGGGGNQSANAAAELLGLGALGDISRISTRELEALSSVISELRSVLDPTIEGFDRLDNQLRETIGSIGRQLERRDPNADFLTRRVGPRGSRAISEGLIGGAFPLLFGQGIGASIGGLAGGAAGGFAGGNLGFGLSLIGTALGTAFDTAVQSATELGAALEKPVENFDKLTEKSFISSKALETQIRKTIEYGDVATASALIQEEAFKKLGVGGVNNLKNLGAESDRLNRAFAELGQQMQAVAAGPLSNITGFFADIFGQAAAAGRVRLLRADLNPQQTEQFNQEVLQRLKERGVPRGFFAPSTPTESEIGILQQQGALQDIVDKWQALTIKGKIKITEKEKLQSELNGLQKQLEVIDIGRGLATQIRQAAREQQDLDRQRADLVRSYEESLGSIRQRIEDEVANKRFATIQKENDLLDLQGQIRLKSLEVANRGAIAEAGAGQRPEVEQAAKEVAGIVADFTEQQLAAEEEAAKIKRDAAFEAQKIDFEGAKFKADIEKEVSRLNVETARKVAEINEQVKRRNEEYDQNRFKLEKRIAEVQLRQALSSAQEQIAAVEKQLQLTDKTNPEAQQNIKYFNNLLQVYKAQEAVISSAQSDIAGISAPAPLRGVGAVGGGGVSTSGLDKATAGYKTAIQNFVNAQLELNKLTAISSTQDFSNRIDAFIKQVEAPLKQNIQAAIDADEERLAYARLINDGLTETQAKKALEIQQAIILADLTYETAIAELERRKSMDGTTEAMRQQIDLAIERLEITREKSRDQMPGLVNTAIESERGKQIFDFITQTKAQLNDLEAYSIRVSQGIGNAIGNSLSSGIAGLIEGTTTAKEVFSTFLKDMGMILIEEGTKMIAMYIAIGIAKQFAGLFGGSTGGAGGAPGVNVNPAGTGIQPIPVVGLPAANGAYFDGGMAYFAKGGIVGSPTLFQFADGGTMQTGLMGEAGPEAIMPLKRTPDGRLGVEAIPFQGGSAEASMDASIPFQGSSGSTTVNNFQQLQSARIPFTKSTEQLVTESRERETVSAINNPKPLDVRFESQVINGVEYVTAEQHQRGMAQAAERGRALALSALQNSVKTRKQVGIG